MPHDNPKNSPITKRVISRYFEVIFLPKNMPKKESGATKAKPNTIL